MSPSQSTYQRIKATPSVSTAKKMYFLSGLLSLFISSLAVTEGAVMFAYFQTKGCDPLEAKQLRNQNQILDITGACFTGAMVGVFVLGWFIPRANALGGFVGGLVCVIFVGWISVGKLISSGVRVNAKLGPASTENCPLVNISGFTNGNIYVQMMTEFVSNDTDSIAGAGHMTVTQGPQGLDVLYSLSYKWLLPLGICLVVGVGALVSRLQARKPVDPSLTVPVCDYLCCCIPERIRKKFRCGIKDPGRDE
ncbi:sodium-dependent multivitamin transporter-like, partial [Mizuhopecten yessoensis]|uniref:sodium-dependent multivitamin transporter-like n=1 Tax=Mizuhopecten yessoensis TaxID=6573 RepID=UPI000B45A798